MRKTSILLGALLVIIPSAGTAQQTLDDKKKQAEIDKLEAERDKIIADREKVAIDAMKGAATGVAGSGTVSSPELSAEGLLLSHYLQEEAAVDIADAFQKWLLRNPQRSGPAIIAFGDQPPTTADYYALKGGVDRLRDNLLQATADWEKVKPGAKSESTKIFSPFAAVGVIPAVITAVTTVASLLKVDTTVAGSALASPNEQFKAILLSKLRERQLPVDPPLTIAGEPKFASKALGSLKDAREAARLAHDAYMTHVKELAEKDKKPSKDQATVGASLATALADYDTLRRTLFTPVAGILPAHVVDQQAMLAEQAGSRPIIYIHHQKAALTTTTKKGLLTGIRGIPASVSGSLVVDYSFAGDAPQSGAFTVSTPTKRITDIHSWLAPRDKLASAKAGN